MGGKADVTNKSFISFRFSLQQNAQHVNNNNIPYIYINAATFYIHRKRWVWEVKFSLRIGEQKSVLHQHVDTDGKES